MVRLTGEITTSRGRPVEMVIEYTGYDRPRVPASTTSMATAEVTPIGEFRLLTPVITLLGRQEQRIWTALRRQLEALPD